MEEDDASLGIRLEKKRPLVNVDELDPNLRQEILKERGGERFSSCFQCGTCVASCPVSLVDEKYNVRRIIRMAILGMSNNVLSSELVWLCSSCYLCHERCPQDVRIPDLMNAIKNIAARKGFYPYPLKKLASALRKYGYIYEVDEFVNSDRRKLCLPEIEKRFEDIIKIFEETGLDEIIGNYEE